MAQVLSIESSVSYGFVGNSAAVFALRRMGVDAWPVPTVNLSNHNGYPTVRSLKASPEQVLALVRGLDELGVLSGVNAVLSGYLSSPAMGEAVLSALDMVQRRRPDALICCDPVMGERTTGFYCAPGTPDFFRDELVPRAQLVTPNLFELETLTGRRTRCLSEVVQAAQELRELGPSTVLVTSVEGADVPSSAVAMIVAGPEGVCYVQTPRQDRSFSGSGDLTAAVFLAQLLGEAPLDEALAATAGAMHGIVSCTAAMGSRELALVQAQDELVDPTKTFTSRWLQT